MGKEDPAAKKLRDEFWKHGHYIRRTDDERGANEGLGPRERKALAEENHNAWGQRKMWAKGTVTNRARKGGNK